MNGTNSNTSGANVANVGYWPSAILPAVVSQLEGKVIPSLKGLIEKSDLAGTVDFAAQAGSDKISDVVMEEIARRIIVTLEKADPGNIAFQPIAPDDHSKLWWRTDAITGFPIAGELRQWDSGTGTWVRYDDASGAYVAPERRSGTIATAAGTSTVNFDFEDIKTSDYRVTLTPTLRTGGDSYAAPPASWPNNFGYAISNKTNTSLSVVFFGIPLDGLLWEVDIEDRQATA